MRVTLVASCNLINLEFSGQLHAFDTLLAVAFRDGAELDG